MKPLLFSYLILLMPIYASLPHGDEGEGDSPSPKMALKYIMQSPSQDHPQTETEENVTQLPHNDEDIMQAIDSLIGLHHQPQHQQQSTKRQRGHPPIQQPEHLWSQTEHQEFVRLYRVSGPEPRKISNALNEICHNGISTRRPSQVRQKLKAISNGSDKIKPTAIPWSTKHTMKALHLRVNERMTFAQISAYLNKTYHKGRPVRSPEDVQQHCDVFIDS